MPSRRSPWPTQERESKTNTTNKPNTGEFETKQTKQIRVLVQQTRVGRRRRRRIDLCGTNAAAAGAAAAGPREKGPAAAREATRRATQKVEQKQKKKKKKKRRASATSYGNITLLLSSP